MKLAELAADALGSGLHLKDHLESNLPRLGSGCTPAHPQTKNIDWRLRERDQAMFGTGLRWHL